MKKVINPAGRTSSIQLKSQREVNSLRGKLVEEQGGVCPISGWAITRRTAHLDHNHQSKMCRAALHPAVNRALSQDSMRRFGIPYEDQPRILRAMADYLENHKETVYIHLSAKPKEPIIKKSNYDALGYLIMDNAGKLPGWWGYVWKKPNKRRSRRSPGQKLTKRLKALYKKYDFEPSFYSSATR